jgi:hypothetical protein
MLRSSEVGMRKCQVARMTEVFQNVARSMHGVHEMFREGGRQRFKGVHDVFRNVPRITKAFMGCSQNFSQQYIYIP